MEGLIVAAVILACDLDFNANGCLYANSELLKMLKLL